MSPDQTEAAPALGDPADPARLRRARWAATVPFLITGLVFASYFVRIPSLKLEFGLSEGQLGLLLTLPILTGLVAMQLTGALVARYGSAAIVRITMVGLPLSLLGIALAASPAQLALALLLFGAVDGLIDISMNAHTIAVERALKRPIMNSCHAAWSIGAAVGSALGGLAIKAGLSPTEHFLLVAVVLAVASLPVGRQLLSSLADRTERRPDRARGRGDWRTGWTPRVLLFGATGTVVLVCGGVVGNWSGVFLHEDLGASLAMASLGYIAFSVCEAGGRLVGDRLHARYGASAVVRCCGPLAVAGLAVVVLSPVAALAVAGFAVMGLGLSVLVPIIFSAVGHGAADGDPGSGSTNAAAALAKVSTLTYSGLLVGPMLVGWFAGGFGLTATLAGLLVLLAVTLGVGLRRL